MSAPIPVTLLTGFLGSGKTTLLNRLLQHPALAQSAVIINEFGEIGLDHLLVATPAENMVLLDTGCLCCALRGDLVETLTDLHARRVAGAVPFFDRLLVETTGLADPVPVVQTIVADPVLARVYALHDVVTLVDAVHGEAQLDTYVESVKQVAVADALIITKTDLAPLSGARPLRERLRRINPGAAIHEAVHGAIDPTVVMSGRTADSTGVGRDLERWLDASPHEAPAEAPGHDAADHRHDGRITAFAIYRERPIRRAGLMMWLDMLSGLCGASLLRVKALLNVEGDPVVIHAVQTIVHEPVVLDRWPGEDRRSRLVFIVRDMQRTAIERTFDAFDYAPAQLSAKTIDPDTYARFVEAMKGFRQPAP